MSECFFLVAADTVVLNKRLLSALSFVCLQIVANSFLANLSTSATFATILVEYLLKHMEEMGCK